jgi:hypothetical protein
MGGLVTPSFLPQTNYIHPRITGDMVRYFEWMGAAHYAADRRAGAMHGKVFLLESIYAGIDQHNVYGRVDFAGEVPAADCEIVVNLESWADRSSRPRRGLRLNVRVKESRILSWNISDNGDQVPTEGADAALARNFEFKIPLALLYAQPPESISDSSSAEATKIRLRVSIWQNRLPMDALPLEGWIDLQLLPEHELLALAH